MLLSSTPNHFHSARSGGAGQTEAEVMSLIIFMMTRTSGGGHGWRRLRGTPASLAALRLRNSAAPSVFAPLHACITLWRYAYETPPRRARSLRGTQRHFAIVPPTILSSAERVCSVARQHHFAGDTPTILGRTERVRSAHPGSLCCCYTYDTPPHQARSLRCIPASLYITMPTTLRCAKFAALLPGRIWSGLYALVPPPMTFTSIPPTTPISLSFTTHKKNEQIPLFFPLLA